MIIPVRCFTCGKVIGDKWEKYLEKVEASEIIHADTDSLKKDHKSPEFEAMESLGTEREREAMRAWLRGIMWDASALDCAGEEEAGDEGT